MTFAEDKSTYVAAWSEMMQKIWLEKLGDMVYSGESERRTGALRNSLVYSPIEAQQAKAVAFRFSSYGIYVERGTGKEKYKGNPGKGVGIGDATKNGNQRKLRQPKPWFSKKWRSSIYKLSGKLADIAGEKSVRSIVDVISKE